jgi:excisionase family DNA binding protein
MKATKDSQTLSEPTLLLTIAQSAKLVGIGRTTAYALVKSGEWRTIKIGRLRRLTREILEDWIAQKVSERSIP